MEQLSLTLRRLPGVLTLAAAVVAVCVASSVGSASSSPEAWARLSHLTPHADAPPDSLMQALMAPDAPIVKGYSPREETALAAALATANLRQRVLRVAVAEAAGSQMALIKMQASDQASGAFRVADLESDAVSAVRAAFSALPRLQHLDLWSAVASADDQIDFGELHRPIFSIAVSRQEAARLRDGGPSPRELLARVGVTRYDPLFLRHASDHSTRLASLETALPASAFSQPAVGDEWDQLLRRTAASPPVETEGLRVLLRGRQDRKVVAITIDDGPHPLVTPLMLAVLRQKAVRATFFVVGKVAEEYPALVREIAAAGHELGNHTYHHRRLSAISAAEAAAEISACSTVIARLTGASPRYMRPPGGDFCRESLYAIAASGTAVALWTHNTGDWRERAPDKIAARALAGVGPGSVILMHSGDLNSVEALGLIIEGLRRRGLEPVTMSELGASGGDSYQTIGALLSYRQNGWRPSELE